ncbi:MAG: membrane protein insertion efficiency factor YidD [Pseudomonadota bacterium]
MSGFRRRAAFVVLKAYKTVVSPVFAAFGARCRHAPTCSEYAAEAVSKHGLWAGGWMALARLLRCRPGGSSGWDPVPEERKRAPFWAPWAYGDWRSGDRPAPQD